MADPTKIVDAVAPVYAKELGEDWDTLSEKRQREYRALAYKIYEVHVQNKLSGFRQAIEIVEMVQTAPSTPKSWLRGVQEAKNALLWALEGFEDDITTRVTVPDYLPDDFTAEDPHASLRAGDEVPSLVPPDQWCGAEHDELWTCTRAQHPDHWMHWDADPGRGYDEDEELYDAINGKILATWHENTRLDTLHPALGDLDDE